MKKIAIHHNTESGIVRAFMQRFTKGMRKVGYRPVLLPFTFDSAMPDADLAMVSCVAGDTRRLFEFYNDLNVPILYTDKGYIRDVRIRDKGCNPPYIWRLSVNSFQPHHYLDLVPSDYSLWRRYHKGPVKGRRDRGDCILYAGSSQKYCDWKRLGNATDYARSVLDGIRRYSQRIVIYRPKPSWRDAEPIEGCEFSPPKPVGRSILEDLKRSWVLVTYGSGACLDAVLNGVPSIVLGDGITRKLGSTSLSEIENPIMPDRDKLLYFLGKLAMCQFTLEDYASGSFWRHVEPYLDVPLRGAA